MSVAECVRWLRLAPTWDQLLAMCYLERRGYRVCVDFGYANAIAKAREDWRNRKKKKVSIKPERSKTF
jgi:hypothetical protein